MPTMPILTADLDGNIMAWNGAAQRLYGWSETEALALQYLLKNWLPKACKRKS